jgi:hypothetical protein
MINAMCEEEKEFTDNQATARMDWSIDQLAISPHFYY